MKNWFNCSEGALKYRSAIYKGPLPAGMWLLHTHQDYGLYLSLDSSPLLFEHVFIPFKVV